MIGRGGQVLITATEADHVPGAAAGGARMLAVESGRIEAGA